jgi:hypothetical protein
MERAVDELCADLLSFIVQIMKIVSQNSHKYLLGHDQSNYDVLIGDFLYRGQATDSKLMPTTSSFD